MLEHLPPGSVLVLGALVVPLLRGVPRQAWLLVVPILSFAHLLSLAHGSYGHILLFDVTLTVTRIDKLSLVWGYIFHIAAFLSALYAAHVKDGMQQVAALIYAGSAIAGAFAGGPLEVGCEFGVTDGHTHRGPPSGQAEDDAAAEEP